MAKYSRKAQKKIGKVMHEQKKGKLKSGGSGKKVTSRKQAIAIAISEARETGAKVPPKKAAKKGAKRVAAKKTAPKKSTAKKTTRKSSPRKKTARKATRKRSS
ncbi:MAG: hypothetical protein H7Y31_13620 [Chitinophagaceae bacterium]|nr:hypothetical protein [Chitinophagaceae bacterium]